jgi:hypothetical protein
MICSATTAKTSSARAPQGAEIGRSGINAHAGYEGMYKRRAEMDAPSFHGFE